MILKTLLVNILLLTLLTACATIGNIRSDEQYESPRDNALVCKIPYDVQRPQPITWSEVEWTVINNQRIATLQEEINSGNRVNLIALDPQNYENLTVNLAELKRYLRVQTEIINGLEEYYSLDGNVEN